MVVKINETGKKLELLITNPEIGLDYSDDMIGNSGATTDGQFYWDDDNECYLCDQKTYDWWADHMAKYEAADEKLHEYKQGLLANGEHVLEKFQEKYLHPALNVEFSDEPDAILSAIRDHRRKDVK